MIRDKDWLFALKLALSFAAVGILIFTVVKLAPIIAIFIIALLVVYLLIPLVNFLVRHRFPPLLAAVTTVLIVLLVMFIFFYFLIPGIYGELSQLTTLFSNGFFDSADNIFGFLERFEQRFDLSLADLLADYYTDFAREAPRMGQQILKYLANFSVALVSKTWIALMLVFLVFYLVQDLEKAKSRLTLLAPQIYKKNVGRILGIIDQKVGAFIRGTLLKSLFVGLLTGGGLAVLGLPFALMLGALAGILNIILYIGPVLAAVPALLLTFLPGAPNFFLVLVVYLVVQALDGFVFTPIFLGKAVDLSPLTVIAVIMIGGQLGGVTGIVLAVPLSAIFKVLLVDYYLARNNNTPEEET
ncbi:MAG: AI-2E family transporter [Firmicutes bacterium]|nr:AI-2E family transporter [Bacillota bacterium]